MVNETIEFIYAITKIVYGSEPSVKVSGFTEVYGSNATCFPNLQQRLGRAFQAF